MILKLPLPPTLNQTYKISGSRMYKSSKVRAWENEAGWELKKQWKKKPNKNEFEVDVDMYLKRDRDTDSTLKVLLDLLEGVVYDNDRQVTRHQAFKYKDIKEPRLEISILDTGNLYKLGIEIKQGHAFSLKKNNLTTLGILAPNWYKTILVDSSLVNKGDDVDILYIEDGDYLIVESSSKKPKNGDIVVSVFDGLANIKKFHFDQENNRVVLISESTKDFPPIFIHEDDDFNITGYVTQVVKKPNLD